MYCSGSESERSRHPSSKIILGQLGAHRDDSQFETLGFLG